MASSPSSTSLSTENEVELNPYQANNKPGPKGAYEARQAKGGLYIRVDMPGVPSNGVKLVKYSETRTVTFTGRAPKNAMWPCDSADRVYTGYVVLDRDPNEVVGLEMTVKFGSLRLFFPGAEGTLHFLPPKKNNDNANDNVTGTPNDNNDDCWGDQDKGSVLYWPCVGGSWSEEPNVRIGTIGAYYSHHETCEHRNTVRAEATTTREFVHINPYLLQGPKGVYEKKIVMDDNGGRLFLRVDMPGLKENNYAAACNDNRDVTFQGRERIFAVIGGEGRKEHYLDDGGRIYHCCLLLTCDCCEISGLTHQVKNGVMRVTFRKRKATSIKRSPKATGYRP